MRILIQVFRHGEWRKVQTVTYDPERRTSKRNGEHIEFCRKDAIRFAIAGLSAWRDYHLFRDCDMRLAEADYYGTPTPIAL